MIRLNCRQEDRGKEIFIEHIIRPGPCQRLYWYYLKKKTKQRNSIIIDLFTGDGDGNEFLVGERQRKMG